MPAEEQLLPTFPDKQQSCVNGVHQVLHTKCMWQMCSCHAPAQETQEVQASQEGPLPCMYSLGQLTKDTVTLVCGWRGWMNVVNCFLCFCQYGECIMFSVCLFISLTVCVLLPSYLWRKNQSIKFYRIQGSNFRVTTLPIMGKRQFGSHRSIQSFVWQRDLLWECWHFWKFRLKIQRSWHNHRFWSQNYIDKILSAEKVFWGEFSAFLKSWCSKFKVLSTIITLCFKVLNIVF